jgi:hypothetical protein
MLMAALATSPAPAQDAVAVRAGRIITQTGPPVENGAILIRNGKIVAIGPADSVRIPPGTPVVDASSQVVMPGLVAAYSTLASNTDANESISPDIRAIDGVDLFATNEKLLRGGLTTAYLATGSHRLVSGQGGVVKLGGVVGASRTLIETSDVRISPGDLSKNPTCQYKVVQLTTTKSLYHVGREGLFHCQIFSLSQTFVL